MYVFVILAVLPRSQVDAVRTITLGGIEMAFVNKWTKCCDSHSERVRYVHIMSVSHVPYDRIASR